MPFPSWYKFIEKTGEYERIINDLIIKFKNEHPLLNKAILDSLNFLPSPFNVISQNIYNNFESSEDVGIKEVMKSIITILEPMRD